MTDPVRERVRQALGPDAVEADASGTPRVAPASTEAVARVLALAHHERWKVRIQGQASWCHPDAPADLVLTTSAMREVVQVSPGDLVATLQAGTPLAEASHRLEQLDAWLGWDPPGRPGRSIGSIVATGTAGPLRHRVGPIRDQVLGCTVVTGDGRILRPGGSVVKNVAGYDLAKLVTGGFGAFGVITEVHLRLRTRPAGDRTWVARGDRDRLTLAGRDLTEAAVETAALELLSPAVAADPEWVLALRLAGSAEAVEAEAHRVRSVADLPWEPLETERAGTLWHGVAHAILAGQVTLRLGVLLPGLDGTLDLVGEHLDLGLVTAGAGSGALRWSGEATAEQIGVLRRAAAEREIPLTVERGPWALRVAVGHFGQYREGVGQLVGRLRDAFDPGHVLQIPLDAAPDD